MQKVFLTSVSLSVRKHGTQALKKAKTTWCEQTLQNLNLWTAIKKCLPVCQKNLISAYHLPGF